MRLMSFGNARYLTILLFAFSCIFVASNASAEIKTKSISYKDGNITLMGELAWDDSDSGKRPGILVIDEWWGLTDWAKNMAKQLAAAGYIAFAADMYGDGKTTGDPAVAKKWMTEVTSNTDLWRRRAQMGLDVLKADKNVNDNKLAAMGSSFGGATAIQMSYWDQDIKAAVIIATGMTIPPPKGVRTVKPRMLIFIGANDKFIPPEKVKSFIEGSVGVDIDYQIIVYSETRHSFTTPMVEERGIENLAYNKRSADRAWKAIMALFDEAFK